MANRIHLLDPWVAERIAAGEVIERPASIVKEMVENALDAGASRIEVKLERGGRECIEVWDNGVGMSAQDLELSVQRHATSKISALEDLEKINTLGFRGEALPSVAAVTELQIISRAQGESVAHSLSPRSQITLKAQPEVSFGDFLGSNHGTRIRATNLFSEIPARLKFLKSQAAEVATCREWLERLALSHPEVDFLFTSDERKILKLEPQSLEERLVEILGDGNSPAILSDSIDHGSYQATAYWLRDLSVPHTRKLVQILNSRVVRDRLLQQAVLAPFRQSLLPGQFPALLLKLEIKPELLDVNVHPTKTEVRFLDSREVFLGVQGLLERLIQKNRIGTEVYSGQPVSSFDSAFSGLSASFAQPLPSGPAGPPGGFEISPLLDTTPSPEREPLGRFLGQLFETYLLFEKENELIIVDQHAADERVRFEKFKSQAISGAQASAQLLLAPEPIQLSDSLIDRLNTYPEGLDALLKLLSQMGFEAERFGERSLLFRSIPSLWNLGRGLGQLKNRITNLLERAEEQIAQLRPGNSLVLDEKLFEKLAMQACHSSVRSGDFLFPEEARELVRSLMKCQHPFNCPHGRPSILRMGENRFKDLFLRNAPSHAIPGELSR